MSHLPTLPGKTHPLTGRPLRVIGFRRDGRPILPIMGGDPSNDPPERPEDVSEEEWNALGDPGKQALVRVRTERDNALTAQREAERNLQAARARPGPPKNNGSPSSGERSGGDGKQDPPDFDKLIQDAVNAAIKPFQDREVERDAAQAAQKIADAVKAAATDLHDPSDALANIDLTKVTDGNGGPDAEKIKGALADLVQQKPHLVKDVRRFAPPSAGPSTGSQPSMDDRVKETLARMQSKATGVKFATSD